eukprot:TRINITY_DN2434_c0_g1_i1.p1 TRINITY_DN2434_c0_g1~~TRINITY_DN2434_c0_g1_i1.p1  ORF type:complete len:368 (-),score=133.29 TRINITY_DN2434_c0_g1_i1:201-1259(-)
MLLKSLRGLNLNTLNSSLKGKNLKVSASSLKIQRGKVDTFSSFKLSPITYQSVAFSRSYGAKVFKGEDEATKEDKSRIADAMAVKQEEISENAEGTVQKMADKKVKYSVPSVDFGENYNMPHPLWHNEYIWRVSDDHRPTENFADRLAKKTIDLIKFNFDVVSGWAFGKPTINKALIRIVFLESLAGVPGSVAGVLRHLQSLRRMKRDHGWIHTLFEEAENERMHLLIYMSHMKPGKFFRGCVWISQGIFFNFFFMAYLINPIFCHRLVGYLEEGAVKTYGQIINEVQNGELKEWQNTPAPEIARQYWKMEDNSTMLDVLAVTRADEAHHRDVNHAFAGLQPETPNPYKPGH